MKIIIMSLILILTISIAKADWIKTAVVLSALDSGSQQVVRKDKYSEMIDVIQYKLPRKGFYAAVEYMEFDIPAADQEYFVSYFKNAGYNVRIKDNKLYFDYTGHSAIRKKLDLEEKESFKRLIAIIGSMCLIGFVIFIIRIYIESKAEEIVGFINNKIMEKSLENKEHAKIYSIERLSLKEKYEFVKKYGPIVSEIKRNNKNKFIVN